MKKLFLLAIAGALAACTSQPQNAQQMRDAVRGGAAFTTIDRYVVARPFSTAFANIRANADRCFNTVVRYTYMDSGLVHSESVPWHSLSRQTGQNTAETTLQMAKDAIGPKMPAGGWIKLLTDIEGMAGDKTALTVYRVSIPSTMADISQALPAWAEGKQTPCPKLG
jgi:hypothetical protein